MILIDGSYRSTLVTNVGNNSIYSRPVPDKDMSSITLYCASSPPTHDVMVADIDFLMIIERGVAMATFSADMTEKGFENLFGFAIAIALPVNTVSRAAPNHPVSELIFSNFLDGVCV